MSTIWYIEILDVVRISNVFLKMVSYRTFVVLNNLKKAFY